MEGEKNESSVGMEFKSSLSHSQMPATEYIVLCIYSHSVSLINFYYPPI